MVKAKSTTTRRYVVICTDSTRRGIFGGYLESYDQDKQIAVMSEARMAVYFSANCKGVLGLAGIGPQKGSKISPAAPTIELNGVTAVMDCTEEAKKQWELGIWS